MSARRILAPAGAVAAGTSVASGERSRTSTPGATAGASARSIGAKATLVRERIDDEVEPERGGGGGFVPARQRMLAAAPPGLEVEGAVDDAQVAVDGDAF